MSDVRGIEQLKANFAHVKEDMVKRTARTAVASGARVIRNAAKANAMTLGFRKSGNLIRNIKSFQRRSGAEPGTTVFSVGVVTKGQMTEKAKAKTKRDPFYWRFLEFGWMHSGTTEIPARPFVGPALQQNQEAAITAMADSVANSLTKYGAK